MKILLTLLLFLVTLPTIAADINITNVTKAAIVKGADEILMVVDGTKSRLVPVSKALDLLQFPSNSPPIVYTTNLYATYITNNYLFSTNINVYTQTVQCAYITNLYVTNVTANYVTNEYSYITNLYSTYITNEYLYTTNIFNDFFTNNYSYITNLYSTYITNEYLYTTNIYNDYLTNNYLYTTNVTANYITNNYLYTTNLYTSNLYATNIFTTNLYATNIYSTNLFVTNLYATYIYGLTGAVDNIVATNGFLMTTNPIPAQVLSVGRSYMTNIAGDMTLGAFANVPNNYTWAIYLYVTNSSATDYKITFPNGTKCQGHGTPPVIYVTNKQEAAFQITGYGQLATNVNWSPYY